MSVLVCWMNMRSDHLLRGLRLFNTLRVMRVMTNTMYGHRLNDIGQLRYQD
jgi:hypothetical protein